MNRNKKILFTALLAGIFCFQNVSAQVKLAQTGFQFLSITQDARSAALADAMTTIPNQSGSLFSNPAMLAAMDKTVDVMLSQNNWIADIRHNALSAALQLENGQYGVVGISMQLVDYGEVQSTMVARNEQGFLDLGTIEPSAYALGVGYARALSDQFLVGGQVKYVSQYLGPAVTAISGYDLDYEMTNHDCYP